MGEISNMPTQVSIVRQVCITTKIDPDVQRGEDGEFPPLMPPTVYHSRTAQCDSVVQGQPTHRSVASWGHVTLLTCQALVKLVKGLVKGQARPPRGSDLHHVNGTQ